jgi:hypothetical protein
MVVLYSSLLDFNRSLKSVVIVTDFDSLACRTVVVSLGKEAHDSTKRTESAGAAFGTCLVIRYLHSSSVN